jgi:lysozyme
LKSTDANFIATAKQICIEQLLVPWEGTGPRTADGGFRAYPDPGTGGVPFTIAWGLTYHPDGRPVQPNETWNYEYAVAAKARVLDKFVAGVLVLCPGLVNEHPNRLAAVVSFAYNCGLRNLQISTLRRKINAGEWSEAALEFAKWNKAAGRVMRGLTRRRQAEARLFMSQD